MINYEKLNKFQYEAVMHDKGPALLLAGAGTGKTRTLIYRVAHLIESGVSPESILLLTFTNKAANEMKERAEKMLKEKCGITACTYHSFCVKMLRFYGKMAGISPDFTIISGPDEADIIDIVKSELNFQKLKNTNILLILILFFAYAGQWAAEIKRKDIKNRKENKEKGNSNEELP